MYMRCQYRIRNESFASDAQFMRLSRLSTFPDLVSVCTAPFTLPSGSRQPVKPWMVCERPRPTDICRSRWSKCCQD